MIVARRTAQIVLPHLRDVPPLPAHLNIRDLRLWILARHRAVDLPALLDAAWAHGIAVFHFSPLPFAGRKFAGMAYYEDKRPIVILATGYDAPPRVAFYLAHEIAKARAYEREHRVHAGTVRNVTESRNRKSPSKQAAKPLRALLKMAEPTGLEPATSTVTG